MGFSVWQLLIILAIVLLLFGAKRLRNLGTDLGASVKGFRDSMKEDEKANDEAEADSGANTAQAQQASIEKNDGVIDGEVLKEKDKV